jgi:hypothetical protein
MKTVTRARLLLSKALTATPHVYGRKSAQVRGARKTSLAPLGISMSRNLIWRTCVTVCTENSILVAYVTESPNVSGDDRSVRPLLGPVRFAVQVEEPTGGRERCASTSADRVEAEGARSRSPHEWGSLALGPAVSMFSVGPQGHHDHPAPRPSCVGIGPASAGCGSRKSHPIGFAREGDSVHHPK